MLARLSGVCPVCMADDKPRPAIARLDLCHCTYVTRLSLDRVAYLKHVQLLCGLHVLHVSALWWTIRANCLKGF